MEIIEATKEQIVAEIQKIQNGEHIIFTKGYVTQVYFQNLLLTKGLNAELKLIGDAINFLIRRGICTFVFATKPGDFDRLTFKKPPEDKKEN